MRCAIFALTAFLPAAGLLTGCAMNTGTNGAAAVAPPAIKSVKGKAFGGQQAVANSTIVVYEYGSTGYGSAGAAIAPTTSICRR